MSNNLYKCYYSDDEVAYLIVAAPNDDRAKEIFHDEMLMTSVFVGKLEAVEATMLKRGVPRMDSVLDEYDTCAMDYYDRALTDDLRYIKEL